MFFSSYSSTVFFLTWPRKAIVHQETFNV